MKIQLDQNWIMFSEEAMEEKFMALNIWEKSCCDVFCLYEPNS